MFDFVRNLLWLPAQRAASCLAIHGSGEIAFDLNEGVLIIVAWQQRLGLPDPNWITFNYGDIGDRKTKTQKFDSWRKSGRSIPGGTNSIEFGREISSKSDQNGFVDWIWYASTRREDYLFLSIDLAACHCTDDQFKAIFLDAQALAPFEYGYRFEMDIERGPALYGLGCAFNPGDNYSLREHHELSKWAHAKGECKKLGLPISDLLRDVYPLNFLNPRHLAKRVKGQALGEWIDADPRRGSLTSLIEGKLWTWQVPENRIAAIRKVLGPARLLVSWGDFNTPSGGPIGDSYGSKQPTAEPPKVSGLPLSPAERQWIETGLTAFKPILERYTERTQKDFERLIRSSDPTFGTHLDKAFGAWTDDARPDRPSTDQALQAFAAALGEHLVHRFGMAWYAVEDEHGRSLGVVHRTPKGAQTWAYPVDSVAKRIERGESGFIAGVVVAVEQQIRQGQ